MPDAASPTDTAVEIVRRGVVSVTPDGERLLVIRRSHLVVAPRLICFPGGGIEPGETEPQALRREMDEELGTDVEPLRCLWRSVTPWRVELAWWLTRLPSPLVLKPNPAEVESVDWLTARELLDHPDILPSNREFLLGVVERQVNLGA